MVTLVFVFGITFSLIQGCMHYIQHNAKVRKSIPNSTKIGTRGFFPYGEYDGDVNFCFWHNVLPDSGSSCITYNRKPKWENQYRIRHSGVYAYGGFKSWETNRFCDRMTNHKSEREARAPSGVTARLPVYFCQKIFLQKLPQGIAQVFLKIDLVIFLQFIFH